MSKRLTIEYIKDFVEKKGFKLVSTFYKNRLSPLTFICSIHGEFQSTFNNTVRTSICQKCGYLLGSKKQALSIEKVKNIIIDKGYIPLFDTYKNARTLLPLKCPKHGDFKITLTNLCSGKKCKMCSSEIRIIKNSLKIEEVFRRIESKGCMPIFTKYENCKDKIKVNCPTHGDFESTLEAFTYRNGCPKCSHHYSKSQDEVFDFIKQYFLEVKSNVRDIIPPLEIDVYIPELKLGIEYCGLYWHSEKYKIDKRYHYNKMKKAKKQGIRLITIFEDEWLEKKIK